MRRRTDEVPDTGGHDGFDRLTGVPPSMKDGRRRGLLAGLVDRVVALPVGLRLFLILVAFMAVLAMLAS